MDTLDTLASALGLGAFLSRVDAVCGRHVMLEHERQDAVPHDLVLRVEGAKPID